MNTIQRKKEDEFTGERQKYEQRIFQIKQDHERQNVTQQEEFKQRMANEVRDEVLGFTRIGLD